YFVRTLLNYASVHQRERNMSVSVMNIYADSYMEKNHPHFYHFMNDHGINNISIAGIAGTNSHISILGVINSRKVSGICALLSDIAVCFSMAIYNKKYLNKTEIIATTDSLTKLYNRMAYKNDIVKFNNQTLDLFACVYIDVNELHMYNNKYGHAAGDSMLCSVANALSEVFYGSNIYRMGGDEFLVFTHKLNKKTVEQHIAELNKRVENAGYHISTGLAFRTDDIDIETLVKDAEKRMY
ncbi:MAG: GGDEF domain-containing protein, partial [Clostridia bacterium]|nr:GGDEF domain-containing protein [Clostridia bacterium]